MPHRVPGTSGLPFLRYVLLSIGTVFIVRGLIVIPLALAAVGMTDNLERSPSGGLMSSAFALLPGLLFLAGTLLRWRELRRGVASPATRDVALPSGQV
jgi:hypothetical protein